MTIYAIILSILILSNFLFKEHRKMACFVSFVVLLFFMTFRNYDVGSRDTELVYLPLFEKLKDLDFNYILNNINKYGDSAAFTIFTKFSSTLGNDRFYLFLISFGVVGSVSLMIYKSRINTLFGFLIYFSIYYVLGFYLLRQMIALTFVIFSINYLKSRKIIPFILLVCLGGLFHSSAFVFLIAYPLYKNKLTNVKFVIMISMLILVYIFSGPLFSFLVNRFPNISYFQDLSDYQQNNGWTIPLLFFLSIYLLIVFIGKKFNDEKILYESNLIYIALIFIAMTNSIGEFYRISVYFSIIIITLIPKLTVHFRTIKDKRGYQFLCCSIFLLYFVAIVLSQNSAYNLLLEI